MRKYLKLSNYKRALLSRIHRLFKPTIYYSWEKNKIEKYGNQPLKHPPIFIIGAPRTGSTILYQTLTNKLDILYIDNLVDKFHRNLFFGFWLSSKLYKHKPHNCFTSNRLITHPY